METYVQYPPRKLQSVGYTGPITLSNYREIPVRARALAKEGISLSDADRQLNDRETDGAAWRRPHLPCNREHACLRRAAMHRVTRSSINPSLALAAAADCFLALRAADAQTDPLPSWNDGATKQSITDFVARVTAQGGPDFVPPASASPPSTTTARCGSSSRCTSSSPSRSTASRRWRRSTRNGRTSSRSRPCSTAT